MEPSKIVDSIRSHPGALLAAAAVVGFAGIGGIVYNGYEHRNPLLSAQQLHDVCAQSPITIDDRSGHPFQGPMNQDYGTFTLRADGTESLATIARTYFQFDTQTGLPSLEAANPGLKAEEKLAAGRIVVMNMSDLDSELLPAGSQISSVVKRLNLPESTVECMNGIGGGSVGTDTKVIVPVQSASEHWTDTHVRQEGETYSSIGQQPQPFVSPGSVPATLLHNGDILNISSVTGTIRFLQPFEAVQEQRSKFQRQFYDQFSGAARHIQSRYGISADFLLGQTFHESITHDGLSAAALQAHNLGGIKATDGWKGDTIKLPTWEHAPDDAALAGYKKSKDFISSEADPSGGYYVKVKALFRKYDSAEDFFEDQAKLYKKVYADAYPVRADPYAFLYAIVHPTKESGHKPYATDKNYVEVVSTEIDRMKAQDTLKLPTAYQTAKQ